jgi:hypothetical protein
MSSWGQLHGLVFFGKSRHGCLTRTPSGLGPLISHARVRVQWTACIIVSNRVERMSNRVEIVSKSCRIVSNHVALEAVDTAYAHGCANTMMHECVSIPKRDTPRIPSLPRDLAPHYPPPPPPPPRPPPIPSPTPSTHTSTTDTTHHRQLLVNLFHPPHHHHHTPPLPHPPSASTRHLPLPPRHPPSSSVTTQPLRITMSKACRTRVEACLHPSNLIVAQAC